MSEFQREDRYIVIKRSDLKKVPVAYRSHLVYPMFALLAHLPQRRFAVIESDWPEFEPVWRMIEARVTGVPVPGPQYLCVRYGLLQECSPQDRQYVSSRDYDALAAQRDEGLAREADLRAVHESQNKDYIQSARIAHGAKDYQPSMMMPLANKVAALQQRLAEAENILRCIPRRATAYDSRIDAFLASPGCADGEKPATPAINLPRRKVKTEYSTAEEDAQADAWNAAIDAVQELNR